jgi:hypothetical protein
VAVLGPQVRGSSSPLDELAFITQHSGSSALVLQVSGCNSNGCLMVCFGHAFCYARTSGEVCCNCQALHSALLDVINMDGYRWCVVELIFRLGCSSRAVAGVAESTGFWVAAAAKLGHSTDHR